MLFGHHLMRYVYCLRELESRSALDNCSGLLGREAARGMTAAFLSILLSQELGETALHLAVRTADQTSLHLVDFLVQNWYGFCVLI